MSATRGQLALVGSKFNGGLLSRVRNVNEALCTSASAASRVTQNYSCDEVHHFVSTRSWRPFVPSSMISSASSLSRSTLMSTDCCTRVRLRRSRRACTCSPVTVTTTATPRVAFSDGTYRVGPDIAAGTYRSVATADNCYWARLSGFGGTLDDIIANYFGNSPTIVTIAPADVGFRASNCGGWTRIG